MTQVLIVFLIDRVQQKSEFGYCGYIKGTSEILQKTTTYACILFNLNLHIAQEWQLIS